MIRDKSMHHENIIEAAMAEFLEYGLKAARRAPQFSKR